jgi:hypothetical protein
MERLGRTSIGGPALPGTSFFHSELASHHVRTLQFLLNQLTCAYLFSSPCAPWSVSACSSLHHFSSGVFAISSPPSLRHETWRNSRDTSSSVSRRGYGLVPIPVDQQCDHPSFWSWTRLYRPAMAAMVQLCCRSSNDGAFSAKGNASTGNICDANFALKKMVHPSCEDHCSSD